VATVYASIGYNVTGDNSWRLIDQYIPETFQPFDPSQVAPLDTTVGTQVFYPLVEGHVYLMRYTESATTSGATQTIAALKMTAVQLGPSHATLHWVAVQLVDLETAGRPRGKF